jgi:hypothetical protein
MPRRFKNGFQEGAGELRFALPVGTLLAGVWCDEEFSCVKRDLLQCQKRPTTVSKETYYCGSTRAIMVSSS